MLTALHALTTLTVIVAASFAACLAIGHALRALGAFDTE